MKGMKMSVSWRAVLLGVGIGVVTMTSACAIAAGLMTRGIAATENMGLFAAGILVLSGLLGGVAVRLAGGRGWETVLAAIGELVVLFVLNGVLCGGQVEGIGVTAMALLGGSGAALLLWQRRGSTRNRRRSRR